MEADDFFSPWEVVPIASWKDAVAAIEQAITSAGPRKMAWRGHANASWSLHSSLYRRLLAESGPTATAPKEARLLAFEERVARYARDRWRIDHLPYLELLAQLQHFRAPTRLIDVSLSPLTALWFAVEKQRSPVDDADGRLFAFDVTRRAIVLNTKWSAYDAPWRDDGKVTSWCRELPLFWRPPSYNERIPAQQSGFLVAGVPKVYQGDGSMYRKGPGTAGEFWHVADVRRATSVPTRMVVWDTKSKPRSEPTFTFRVLAGAKEEIRDRLEQSYGISPWTVYPDPFGMATELRSAIDSGELD